MGDGEGAIPLPLSLDTKLPLLAKKLELDHPPHPHTASYGDHRSSSKPRGEVGHGQDISTLLNSALIVDI